VFLPDPEEVSTGSSAGTEMAGVIVEFSDSGPKRRAFAVVVLDDGQKVIIPVEKLKPVNPSYHER